MDKILLIDDNVSFLELAEKYLEAEDFEVICAESGEEGLNLFKEEEPDLVLLDITMPKTDGWEVFERIKRIEPEITVAFLTSMEKLPGTEKHDVDDYIVKESPFTKEKLVENVEELLGD